MQIAQPFVKPGEIIPRFKRRQNPPIAAALRMNDAMKTVSTTFQGDLTTALVSIETHAKSTGDVWRSFGLSFITTLDQMITKTLIIEPMMKALQAAMIAPGTGGLSLLGLLGLGGGGLLGTAGNSMTGAAGDPTGGGIVVTAGSNGGIVGSLPTYGRVHPAYFDDAPRFAGGGMITDGGVPIIAHPGERVLNRQQTAAYNSGGSAPTVNMGDIHIDASGADPAVVARLQSTLAQFRKSQYADTMNIINDASGRGWRPRA